MRLNFDVEIIKIQNSIFKLLNGKNGVSVHFIYKNETLKLITYNNNTNEFFLLKEIVNTSEKDDLIDYQLLCYQEMLTYVENLVESIDNKKPNEGLGDSYSVEWCKVGQSPINISYFYGKDIEDVLKKFYFGKEGIKHMFTIFDVKLNPIS